MSSLEYALHGVRLVVEAPAGAVRDAIDARLVRCRATTPAPADIVLRIGREPVDAPTGQGRPVYPWEPGEVSWFDAAGVLYMTVGEDVRLVAAPASGRVTVWASDAALRDAWLFARPLLTLPLVEMLKWKGHRAAWSERLRQVHAGAGPRAPRAGLHGRRHALRHAP
jgi:hypothetical protein